MKLLLKAGADHKQHNEDGETPLIIAARGGREELCKILLENGAVVHGVTGAGTPLMAAASQGHTSIVKLLLDKGARLDIYPKNGPGSILFLSAHNPDVLRYLLIEKGVPIPDYPVIREEGTVNEKKLSLKELLVENTIGENSLRREQYNEILAFLDRHGN